MNWKRGLFRLWLAISGLWLIIVAVFFYPQVVSPYIEPRVYILTEDLKFFELDKVSDSEDLDFKAAYQTEIEFPNKVTLFAKHDTPKPVLDTQSKNFYEQHVKLRETELATARRQSLELASAAGVLPPLALLLRNGWRTFPMCRPWRSSACLTSSLAPGPALSRRRAHQMRSSTRSIVRSTPRSLCRQPKPSCNHSKRKPCSARRRITPISSPANCRNGSRWQSCRVH